MMASMLGNVLDYLRTKTAADGDEKRPLSPRPQEVPMTTADAAAADEEDTEWVYDIEDQDDWQIVRKMDEEIPEREVDEDELELQDEATHTRHQTLYRSAPPLIMEETLQPPAPAAGGVTRTPSPPRATVDEDGLAPVYQRPLSHKRKRRLRAAARAQALPAGSAAPERRELAVLNRMNEEMLKQGQNEEKERRTVKLHLGKNALQRSNLVENSQPPKKP
ncbi:uncharacterized protein LOC129592814 isoform X2 [Paramacrobiotus metropolitanus]|uniref:uncharacterized protein LOC129592814 isoform X2 n=1 Tax=Paramacrobiotus metropolitanus TaxID=2943436 RepID=UPI0024462C47|nr:uncharacterized protein LOC129592814 isoform X2 [Paramacrobiotus metropolitanus]